MKMMQDPFGNPYYVYDDMPEPKPIEPPMPIINDPIKQDFIVVKSEQEAFDYPIVDSFNERLGKIHFFVLDGDEELYAKRINPSNFEMEFEIYDRRKSRKNLDGEILENNSDERFSEIFERLNVIEETIDMAVKLLNMSTSDTEVVEPETPQKKSNKKPKEGTIDV